MEEDEREGDGHGDHDDDLRRVEAPLLVLHVVEEGVRQGARLRHPVVRQRQRSRRRHPRKEDPHEGQKGLERLGGNSVPVYLIEGRFGPVILVLLVVGVDVYLNILAVVLYNENCITFGLQIALQNRVSYQ